MKIAVIVHRDKAPDPRLEEALRALPDLASYQAIFFEESRDLRRELAALKASKIERALVCGGDGTLHHAIKEMLSLKPEDRVPLGIVPMGTANDFAKTSGFGSEVFQDAVHKTAIAPVRKIDVGWCNGHPFINVASAGVIARATTEVNPSLKHSLGKLSYVLNGLKEAATRETYRLKFRSSSWSQEETCLAFVVGNSATAGGGFKVAPLAKIDDGKLDLMIVPDQGIAGLAALATELFQDEPDLTRHAVSYRQLDGFLVESDKEIQVNLDGEPIFARALDFSVVPGQLDFIVSDELLTRPDGNDESSLYGSPTVVIEPSLKTMNVTHP